MGHPRFDRLLSRILSDYGMVLVLLLLGSLLQLRHLGRAASHRSRCRRAVDGPDHRGIFPGGRRPGSGPGTPGGCGLRRLPAAPTGQRRTEGAGNHQGPALRRPRPPAGTVPVGRGPGRDRLHRRDRPLGRLRPTGGEVPRSGRSQSADAAELPLAQLPQARQLAERGQPDRGHRHSGGGDDHGHHHGGHRPIGGQPDRLLSGDVHLADPRGGLGRKPPPPWTWCSAAWGPYLSAACWGPSRA